MHTLEGAAEPTARAWHDTSRSYELRHRARWLLVACATAFGAGAACVSTVVSATRPADAPAPVAGSPRAVPDAATIAGWPRPLPPEPGQWLRHTAGECGLRVSGLRSEARATTFPLPSGAALVLWEVSLHLAADGPLEGVRELTARLKAAPCTAHVPEADLTWEGPDRVRVQLHAVLMGTWPERGEARR